MSTKRLPSETRIALVTARLNFWACLAGHAAFLWLGPTLTAAQPIDTCVGLQLLTTETGVISDGWHTGGMSDSSIAKYGADASCSWLIQPNWEPASITLSFDTLDLEQQYDFVTVRSPIV